MTQPAPASPTTRSPDLAELETLVACAAEGSMAGAAGLLGISRPAIAKRIRNLEVIAGSELLHRSGRGVALTDAGASLLAGARRLLDDRDILLEAIARLRGEEALGGGGLRRLLASSPAHARAAHQPEARLAEAEELLELVLRASRTGVAISDPQTSEILVANDAFCELTGRSRPELQGNSGRAFWDDLGQREVIIEQLRSSGVVQGVPARLRRPDGSLRFVDITARLITLGGARQVLWCLDAIGIVEGADGERASAGAAALSDLAPKATRGGGLGDLGIGMVGGSS